MSEEFTAEYESPAYMKLLRAGEHFHALELEVDQWNHKNRILAPTRRSATSPNVLEIFKPSEPKLPLLHWSNRFGDGVHSLRSSLDVLAYEMCHLEGPGPKNPKGVYFPVAERERDWSDKTKNLDSVPEVLLRRIQEVQPWHALDPKTHVLAMVNGLDNMNKHRTTADLFAMPAGLLPEWLAAWPGGDAHPEAWTFPWTQVSYDGPVGSGSEPALWDVDAWPLVHFEGRMAFLGELQPWLYRETLGIFQFITSGVWPEPIHPVPEPTWIELPPLEYRPSADSSAF